jgi:hypothetical protein
MKLHWIAGVVIVCAIFVWQIEDVAAVDQEGEFGYVRLYILGL